MLRLASRRPIVAIDLGTAFVRVGTPNEPLLVERPTAVHESRPPAMWAGVVHDIDTAADLLASALQEASVPRTRRARTLVSVPGTATPVERAGVRWAMHAAGVRSEVELIEEPLAAAVGIGLDIADDCPRLVIDIGHGISEAAVIASGEIRVVRGVRVGCAQLGDPRTACAVLSRITEMVTEVLAELWPDEAAAIDAAHLVGGGSLIPEVQHHLAVATGLPVRLDEDRFHAVARGDAVCAMELFSPARSS